MEHSGKTNSGAAGDAFVPGGVSLFAVGVNDQLAKDAKLLEARRQDMSTQKRRKKQALKIKNTLSIL